LSSSDQQAIAKFDMVILGIYPSWGSAASVVTGIKSYNPQILVGNYTVLDEMFASDAAYQGLINQLTSMNWWLVNAAGSRTSASGGGTNDVNITSYPNTTSGGQHEPEWVADWFNTNNHFSTANFDIWYFDNVWAVPRTCSADYEENGTNQSCTNSNVEAAWQAGQVAEWTEARVNQPDMLMEGNADTNLSAAGLTSQLDGAHLECMTGASWSPGSWSAMMSWYLSEPANLKSAQLQEFGGCGSPTDYALFRYTLGATLMGNGFIAYSSNDSYGQGSSGWYDEYNVNLGTALQSAATSTSSTYQAGVRAGSYQNGVWRRDFQNGIALVNPQGNGTKTVTLGGTFYKIAGTQDPTTNNGQGVTSVTLNASDGIVLCNSACANYPRTSSR
jgi:hypothetical protein